MGVRGLVAGIDIGNATTEVVLGRVAADGVALVGAGQAPTRRQKGSPESIAGAAALVRRLERQHGVRATGAVVAPLRPVRTQVAELPPEELPTGRLRVVRAGSSTAGGAGVGVGRPVLVGAEAAGSDPVIVVVPRGIRYDAVPAQVASLSAAGRLAAVLVEDDEGVLVAHRLGVPVPVVDEVPADAVLSATRVAVEVAEDGRPLRVLTDALRLRALLDLSEDELADAAAAAGALFDVTNAVVTLDPGRQPAASTPQGWVELRDLGRLPFAEGQRRLRRETVGAATAYALPPACDSEPVDDLWTVDLGDVAGAVRARRDGVGSRSIGVASMHSDAPYVDPADGLSALLGVPVVTAGSESRAARVGALSTPGAVADAVVVDLGGGTVDVVSDDSAVVAAGAGSLLTASVAALSGSTQAAAEWVKRGPAHRVETPQLMLGEDGARTFLDRPAPAETLGSLVVRGPAGLLAFSRTMSPGEWRALRLALKTDLVGANVGRALRTLDASPRAVVVVGGPAADDEVLAAVTGALPAGVAVGRGDVMGSLGTRYAVACGLLHTGLSDAAPAG